MRVEQSLHFMLLKAEAALAKQLYQTLAEIELSPGQPKLLDYLYEHDGCIQKELASVCEVESATITRLLARMEHAGLIERRTSASDKRSVTVFLTEKGRHAGTVVRERFAGIEAGAFAGLDGKDRKLFLELLCKIYDNLSHRKSQSGRCRKYHH